MKTDKAKSNVNVTLGRSDPPAEILIGKQFPCPTCGLALLIRIARTGKPYCVCLGCGNQLFFRGKPGIARLIEIVKSGSLISQNGSNVESPITLFNRLVQLRLQKTDLEQKQGLIFNDPDLTNAILAVENEIRRVQVELRKMARRNGGRDKNE